MREASLARQAVQQTDVGRQGAGGHEVVRDVGAVARLIRRGARHRNQLAEPRPAVRETVAERADADGERRRDRFEAAAVLFGERSGYQRRGRPDRPAVQGGERIEVEHFDSDAAGLNLTGPLASRRRRACDGRREQQRVEATDTQSLADADATG